MPNLDYLRALREKRGLTLAELSELSGVPLATVNRVFSGSTSNPSFETILDITIALGGSLDVLAGLRSENEDPTPVRVEQTMANYADLLREKDERIKDKSYALKIARRDRTILLCAFICVLVAIIGVLLFDMLNGHVGYIRY